MSVVHIDQLIGRMRYWKRMVCWFLGHTFPIKIHGILFCSRCGKQAGKATP